MSRGRRIGTASILFPRCNLEPLHAPIAGACTPHCTCSGVCVHEPRLLGRQGSAIRLAREPVQPKGSSRCSCRRRRMIVPPADELTCRLGASMPGTLQRRSQARRSVGNLLLVAPPGVARRSTMLNLEDHSGCLAGWRDGIRSLAERFILGTRRRRGRPSEHGTFEVGLRVGSTPRSSGLQSMPAWSSFASASPGAPPTLDVAQGATFIGRDDGGARWHLPRGASLTGIP